MLAGAPGGAVTTKYTYDLHDNVTSVTDPNGNVTTYKYDDFDRLRAETSPVTFSTTYLYDAAGNVVSMTDGRGTTTTYTYDELDRKTSETANDGDPADTLVSNWAYDVNADSNNSIGHLTFMSDPSGQTGYGYDVRGQLQYEDRFDQTGNEFYTGYSYDANGNRKGVQYPDYNFVSYGFDFADRPYSANKSLMLAAVRPGLRQRTPPAMPAQHHPLPTPVIKGEKPAKAPRLRSQGTSLLNAGQLRSTQQGPLTLPAEPRRHALSERAALPARYSGTPDATTGTSQPVNRGLQLPMTLRRAAALPGASSSVYVASATYAPFGPLTSIAYGNGTVQKMTYNQRYLPVTNILTAGTATLSSYTYSEDPAGNIKSIADNLDGTYSRMFAYDDLNRLTTANSGSSLWGTASGNGYTYDAMGNMLSAKLGTTRNTTLTYLRDTTGSVTPEVSTVTNNGVQQNVYYDYGGNQSYDDNPSDYLTYSSRGLLGSDSNKVSSYFYSGSRQRVSTQLPNGSIRDSFFDPQQHLLAETAMFTTGNVPTSQYDYVWFGNRPVAQIDPSGTHWTYSEHLGTPLMQTDINASKTWQAEYDPYGSIWKLRSGDVHQPLRLPGQSAEQFDTGANGLTERSYNNARWYQPSWGRYEQADPLGLRKNPHTYAYALDNPVSWTDFRGLISFPGPIMPPIIMPPVIFFPHGFAITETNWCGPGYADGIMGPAEQSYSVSWYDTHSGDVTNGVDRCCWQHDRCLSSNNQDGCGEHNAGTCACDKQFKGCLSTAKPSFLATIIAIPFPGPNCPSKIRPPKSR